ncbi:MAG: cyclic nucleotide-binding domain-containing protein [Cytophagales bacterium]|nr:cyclic nucleotide-binding domain-containing protein [Cytophagales bacterium]MDW8384047.1 cyclic nucleotide-binding domain-containing protein [Flammeovirgaceae bacterium]
MRNSTLFKSLPEEPLQAIAQKAKCRQFFPNEIIELEGNPSNSLYIIANGIVAVKKIVSAGKEHLFAYLMQGSSFGEVGIIENRPRSATVQAVSDVDVIVIQRQEFMEILHRFPVVAIELARTLGNYLTETNRRISRIKTQAKVILIINTSEGAGGTTLGCLLCETLAEKTHHPTAYIEYPTTHHITADLRLKTREKKYHHRSGFDIILQTEDSNLPDAARTTIMLDTLMNDYRNIVVAVYASSIDDSLAILLEYANLIVLLGKPTIENWEIIQNLYQNVRKRIRREETGLFTVLNCAKKESYVAELKHEADFFIPYLYDFSPIHLSEQENYFVPDPLKDTVHSLIERLERNHQIGIFIPTTINTTEPFDTSVYVQQTLNFLASRFGGATSRLSEGVWNSSQQGLVGEQVHFVFSYTTQSDLSRYMDEIIEFVRKLKKELNQEAIALEIDDKLTII